MILCVKAMCATWQREQSFSVLLGGRGDKCTLSLGNGLSVPNSWPSNLHWIPTQEQGKHAHIKSYTQMSVAILLLIIKRSQQPSGHLMLSV